MANHKKELAEIPNKYLRDLLIGKGYQSLQEASDKTGIHSMTFHRYANNEIKDAILQIIKEAEALGIEPGEWLEGVSGYIRKPKVKAS